MKHYFLFIGDYQSVNEPEKQFIIESDYDWTVGDKHENSGFVVARNKNAAWPLGHGKNDPKSQIWTNIRHEPGFCNWLKVSDKYLQFMDEVMRPCKVIVTTDRGQKIIFENQYVKDVYHSYLQLGNHIDTPSGKQMIVEQEIIEEE